MAKARFNPLIQGIHGRIGDLIFRGSNNGETVVYKAPEQAGRTPKESDSQSHHFREAHAYARMAMAEPEMKAYYEREGKRKRKSAYFLAFSSYLKFCGKLRD